MTLDCKPRRMYPSAQGTDTPTKMSSTQIARSRNRQSKQTHTTLVRHSGVRESTGESFLQRLLEIERRHDEKRMMRQKAAAKSTGRDNVTAVHDEVTPFTRSPTRWISEQIFDDTQDSENQMEGTLNRESFKNKPQPLFTSSYSRLPNLSDVRVISSSSSEQSTSSVFLQRNKQADSEFQIDSLSTISYVEFQPSDDFPPLSPVVRKRPLRLPPILLPPIYAIRPRPLRERDFLTPTRIRGPITDDEWEDLQQCRYIRPAPPGRFNIQVTSSQVSLL